jgi:hypothetical protein
VGVLAESPSPVMVFEAGPPTRYYLNPTEINFEHLTPRHCGELCYLVGADLSPEAAARAWMTGLRGAPYTMSQALTTWPGCAATG